MSLHPISVMLKPASAACNLRCRYCFYADEAAHREIADRGIMRPETLEKAIALFMSAAKGSCDFSFQGGEPTLAGLDFFRRVLALQKQYARPGLAVTNALQTNGTLLNEEWCRFLSENHFLVGLSLDGTKETHDSCRVYPDGKSSFAAVLRAAQMMQAHGIAFHILTVVTAQTARNITKIYSFYKKNGWLQQQYIPCMDPLKKTRGGEPYSLTPQAYAEFLKKLFNLWYQDLMRGLVVSVRHFDNFLRMLAGLPPENCAMAGHCSVQYLVEADGSVYPCDFYALDECLLGNLHTDSVEQIDAQRREIGFIECTLTPPARCKECRWYALCRGGCRRDRTGEPDAHNYYCESYRAFFEDAYPRLRQAAELCVRLGALRT